MQPYKNYAKDKYAGKFELGSNSYGDVLVKNGYEVYRIFIGCDEREGNHIGYISLNHKDLSMHDFSQRNKVPTNKNDFILSLGSVSPKVGSELSGKALPPASYGT